MVHINKQQRVNAYRGVMAPNDPLEPNSLPSSEPSPDRFLAASFVKVEGRFRPLRLLRGLSSSDMASHISQPVLLKSKNIDTSVSVWAAAI